MGKRKLVWIDADDDGRAIATARVSGFVSPTDEEASSVLTKRLRSALDALPSALLIGAEERGALVDMILDAWRPMSEVTQANEAADAILAAGYRKVTAVDREKLVEAIAAIFSEGCTSDACWPDTLCNDCKSKARALLARVEGDSR